MAKAARRASACSARVLPLAETCAWRRNRPPGHLSMLLNAPAACRVRVANMKAQLRRIMLTVAEMACQRFNGGARRHRARSANDMMARQ